MGKSERHLPGIDGNDFYQRILPDLRQIQSCPPQALSIVLFLTQQSHRVTSNESIKIHDSVSHRTSIDCSQQMS